VKALRLALLVTVVFCQPVAARPRSVLDMELVEEAKKEKNWFSTPPWTYRRP
jgi:hypothetical protein